jgi:hypothetical protein
MESPLKYWHTLDDRRAFASKQEHHVKLAMTVIAVVVLAVGLAIAVKDDLAQTSATARLPAVAPQAHAAR